MKLLISTYACLPNRGSDHGVGWNWTTEAHRLGHEVWALVSPAHRNAIEAACRSDAVAGVHIAVQAFAKLLTKIPDGRFYIVATANETV